MPISRAKKEETVAILTERFTACESAVFIDYRGLSVADMQVVRGEFRAAGCHLQVARNRLIRLALANCGLSTVAPDGTDLDEQLLIGPTAVAFGYEQPNAPAEVVLKLAAEYDVIGLKGGFFGTTPVAGAAGVKKIAAMRSKIDSLADIVRIISPSNALRRLVTVAQGCPSRIITVASGAPRRLMALKHVVEQTDAA